MTSGAIGNGPVPPGDPVGDRPIDPLGPETVHVHWTLVSDLDPDALRAVYATVMNDAERARHDAIIVPNVRDEFAVTRALARTTLSRYAPVHPAAWTFRANSYGCPAIDHPVSARWLRFNLTNTRGLVACVVARDRDVGVDAEDLQRPGETVALADRFFAREEVAELRALPTGAQRDRFFDYWTLKEAYIKARGMGLAIPLGKFAFDLRTPGAITLTTDPSLGDDGGAWHLAQFRPTARHLLSLAVRKHDGRTPSIEWKRVIPRAP